MTLLPILAALLAQAAPAKPAARPAAAPSAAASNAAAESAAKAAESAASAASANADATKRAVEAAEHAAESAAKAAESAAKAAESAAKAADRVAEALKPAPAPAAPAAAAPAAADAPAPAGPPPPAWMGILGASAVMLTGNSNTLVFSGKANFERKSTHWIFGFKANGAYGQTESNSTGLTEVTAMQAGGLVRLDRRFTPMISAFVAAGLDMDHLKSIEARPIGELGAAIIWFDTKEGDLAKSSLRTDLGFRYGREFRFQYYPTTDVKDLDDVDIVAPHLGLAFRYAVSKEIIFTQDVDVSVNMVNEVRMLLNAQSKLSAKLTESTALTVQFGVLHDTVPAPATKNTDTQLSIGLDVAL